VYYLLPPENHANMVMWAYYQFRSRVANSRISSLLEFKYACWWWGSFTWYTKQMN